MTRISRRRIERGLRLPAPAPGADLGRRIKEQIPDDLFGAPAEASRRDRDAGTALARGVGQSRAWGRPAVWAAAAALVAVLGAGWLAVRLFEAGDPLSRADLEVAANEKMALPPAAVDRLAAVDAGKSETLDQGSTPRQRPELPASLLEQEPRPAPQPAAEAPAPALRDSASTGAAGGAAPPPAAALETRQRDDLPASPPVRHSLARAIESESDELVAVKQALAKPAKDAARIDGVVGELLAAAADRPGSRTSSAISIDPATGRAAGRIVLLVSATVEDGVATDHAKRAADAFELQLDPALVTGYRLLASHAGARGLVTAPAGLSAATEAVPRVTALYELEVAGALDPSTVLGTVRLRGATTVAIRIADLPAEAALLPDHISPETLTSLRAEIERLRAGSEVDDDTARRAVELIDVLSR